MCRAREKAACFRPSSMLATRNHSLNPDVSPAALTRRPLGAVPACPSQSRSRRRIRMRAQIGTCGPLL